MTLVVRGTDCCTDCFEKFLGRGTHSTHITFHRGSLHGHMIT